MCQAYDDGVHQCEEPAVNFIEIADDMDAPLDTTVWWMCARHWDKWQKESQENER
jgi:hypothetical protein